MASRKLTDSQVRAAKATDKPYKRFDGGGLYLLVTPAGLRTPEGSKLWRIKYRLGGRELVYAVGSYPEVSLAAAREETDRVRALVREGLDPTQQKQAKIRTNLQHNEQQRRDAEGMFRRVALEWLGESEQKFAPGTYRAKRRRVHRYLLPTLGSFPISKISVAEIRPLLQRAKADGAWSGIHLKGDLSAIFKFALVRGLCDSNPVFALTGLLPFPKSRSKTVLTDDLIKRFFSGLHCYRGFPETALALRFIATLACRPLMIANAKWSEFDLEDKLWRRPGSTMKTGQDYVSPLPTQAIQLLLQLSQVHANTEFVIPHRTNPEIHADPARFRYAMRDLNLGELATPHCWRATFSTWAHENGFPPDAIERQLAHVEGNRVRAAYNKSLLIDQRRVMMQAWADHLDAVSTTLPGSVT